MRNAGGGTRYSFIDILKGIGIILMVLGHMHYRKIIEKFIYGFHMPLFFLVSGYLYKQPQNLFGYVKRKTYALIVPYFIVGLLYCILDGILTGNSAVLLGLKGVFVTTTYNQPIESSLWFLPALFWINLIYAWIDKAIVHLKWKMALVTGVTIIGCEWTVFFHYLPWAMNSALSALGFFAIGHWFRVCGEVKLYHIMERTKFETFRLICVGLAFGSGALILLNENLNIRTGTFGILPIAYFCACVYTGILFILVRKLDRYKSGIRGVIVNELANIGKSSIIFLCTNHMMLRVSKKVLAIVGFKPGTCMGIIVEFWMAMFLMVVITRGIKGNPIRKVFGLE